MAVVIATSLRKEHSGTALFDGVSFSVERSDVVALSGPNGAGKTTLLRMLTGETSVSAGEIALAKGTRIALHDQRPPLESGLTLREYTLSGAGDLVALEDELGALEAAMAGGDHEPATLRRYAEAQTRLEHAGGWDWRDRAASGLRGLGFRDEDFDRALDTFSGGELTRASLGRALAGDPDLLLLDEPTNHLDVRSLEWLERTLAGLDAAVILVAHDRWFLEAVATAVLELEAGRSLFFRGPWHEWRREKSARTIAAGKAVARHDADLARLDRFVARFRASTPKMARKAQAKLTQIARVEKERAKVAGELEALTRHSKSLGFDFLNPPRSGRTVLSVEDLDVSAGDRPLLHDVTFAIERGEHVGLVGPNGSGKTTLLETLLARPLGYGVVPAYFSQQGTELDDRGSVLDCAQRTTGLQRPQAQSLLGRFLFTGWDMHERQVTALSGGERRRLSLALLVASGANFLVLDEPTNHLDLESREALEEALEAFPGTVLLVSHDRAVLDAVARRTLAVEDETVRSYDGGWADYVRVRAEKDAARAAATEGPAPVPRAAKVKPAPATPAKRSSSVVEVEEEIEGKERQVADLERRLAEDWANVDTAAAYRRARDELEALLERWEAIIDETPAV